jgi:hypothetical protein
MKTIKRKYVITAIILLLFLFVIMVNLCFFSTGLSYRKLILSAEALELHFLPYPESSKYLVMAETRDKQDFEKLSENLKLRGPWLPIDELSGNSYRIRVINDGQFEDILIRCHGSVMDGNWTARISPRMVDVIREIVKENEGNLPSKEDIIRLLEK